MTFTDPVFLSVFLPSSILIYYSLSKKLRKYFLLLVSFLFFYLTSPFSLLLILLSATQNYLFALALGQIAVNTHKKREVWQRTILVFLPIFFNLFILILSKYGAVLGFSEGKSSWVIPLGISFYTFTFIAYILDVYKNRIRPYTNIIDFLLFATFFPKAVSGPITLVSQFIESHDLLTSNVTIGLQRFFFGLAKKIIIADSLSRITNLIFSKDPALLPFTIVWLGMLTFSLEIYYDFSGYSDMAIGIAKMFGFTLPENFQFPYIATSISDFWKRWHITLSSWFKTYLYIPLGGNRKGLFRITINILIVFSLCGFWHGSGLHYFVWGLWHGVFLILENLMERANLPHIPRGVRWGFTLCIVCIGWIFFRSPTLPFALHYLTSLFRFNQVFALDTISLTIWDFGVLVIAILFAMPFSQFYFQKSTLYFSTIRSIHQKAVFTKTSFLLVFGVSFILYLACLFLIGREQHIPFLYALY